MRNINSVTRSTDPSQISPPLPSPATLQTHQHNSQPTPTPPPQLASAPTLQDLTTNAQHRNIASSRLLALAGSNHNSSKQSPLTISTATTKQTHPNYNHYVSPNSPPLSFMLPGTHTPFISCAKTASLQRPSSRTYGAHAAELNNGFVSPTIPASLVMTSAQQQQPQHRPNAMSHQWNANQLHGHFAGPSRTQANHSAPLAAASTNSVPPNQPNSMFFGSATAPPITILVPYPVLVPVPIPVPIPMPIIAFLRAAQRKLDAERKSREEHKAEEEPTDQQRPADRREHADETAEQPLDCTKTRELCAEDDPEQLIEVVCDDDDNDGDDSQSENDGDDDGAGRRDVGSASTASGQPLNVDKSMDTSKPTTNLHCPTAINEPLPKFKITRLNSRRGFITTTAANSSDANGALPINQASPNQPTASTANSNGAAGNGAVDGDANVLPPVIARTATCSETRLSVASATDKSRPLRKRKRIVDGDYSRCRDDGGDRTKTGSCVGANK